VIFLRASRVLIFLDFFRFVLVLLLGLFGLKALVVSVSSWLDPIPMPATEMSAYNYLAVIGILYLIVAIWHAFQIISYYQRARLAVTRSGSLILMMQAVGSLVVFSLLYDSLNLSSTFQQFLQVTGWLAYANLLLLLLWIVRRWAIPKTEV
jgi:hypothetical protein